MIAVFVVYDTMIDLRPGVSRGDHMSALLVPLALLVVAAREYPRVRPGSRALIAGTLGAIAVAGALFVAGDRPGSGIDWSFLPLLLAGATLLGLATHVAFRSRRKDGRPLIRRTAIGFGLLVFAFEVVLPVILALAATNRPADEANPLKLGKGSEEVAVVTRDGLRLTGTYVPSANGVAVITFPSREWTADESKMLADKGFGVLALDMRGYGGSQGDPNAYGWGATADIDAGVDFLRRRPGVDSVAGLGLSVGGEQMIEAAAGNRQLGPIVSEGAGQRSIRETLIRGPQAALMLPHAAVLTTSTAVFSGESPPPSLEREMSRLTTRALLITAENGNGGEELNEEYVKATAIPGLAELWEVPGATHTGGFETRPAEYAARVTKLLRPQRTMLLRDSGSRGVQTGSGGRLR